MAIDHDKIKQLEAEKQEFLNGLSPESRKRMEALDWKCEEIKRLSKNDPAVEMMKLTLSSLESLNGLWKELAEKLK